MQCQSWFEMINIVCVERVSEDDAAIADRVARGNKASMQRYGVSYTSNYRQEYATMTI